MSEPRKTSRLLVGAALIVVGLVVLVPSGECTGSMGGFEFLYDLALRLPVRKEIEGWSVIGLLFGAPFMAVGLTLVGLGIFHLRRK